MRILAEMDTSSDDSDGIAKPRLGAGKRGRGPPLYVGRGARQREFEDGAGLCCPGRWPPERRRWDQSGASANLRLCLLQSLGTLDLKRL